MLDTVGGKKIDERDFLIKWDTNLKISEDARRITRYPEGLIQTTGKKFDDVFDTIRDWLDSCDYIVGHNILGFDFYLIKEMYLLKGLRANHLVNKILDTNCLAKGIKYGIPKMSKETLIEYQYKLLHTYRKGIKTNLTALGKDYNIDHDYDNLHNAIVDLDLNLKVWNKIKFQVEI
jgi:DNA polymerase III epsilon subunit-like protein